MATKQLSAIEFKKIIHNYEASEEWKFIGNQPAIIDFYADWCGPCKMIAPMLNELSEEYAGRLNIYKVDTEKEQELSAFFDIQSIPTLLFIPVHGNPMIQKGAISKQLFKQVIEERLLKSTIT